MIIVIDNYDSFTYNLVSLLASLEQEVKIIKNDEVSVDALVKLKPTKLILSPGPGKPDKAGICLESIAALSHDIPILGVCLGHQCLGQAYGSALIHSKTIMYGKASKIQCKSSHIFRNLPKMIKAARYHAWVLKSIPDEFMCIASTGDGDIMAIEHKSLPLYGLQFHPESFMTPMGKRIIENFINA